MDEQCKHEHLTRWSNDAQFEFMATYKEGARPYRCDECQDIFWVKPLVITVHANREELVR